MIDWLLVLALSFTYTCRHLLLWIWDLGNIYQQRGVLVRCLSFSCLFCFPLSTTCIVHLPRFTHLWGK